MCFACHCSATDAPHAMVMQEGSYTMRLPTFILAVLLISTPGLALANAGGTKPPRVVEGPARIVDGDTIDISGQRIRLNGIDAPERNRRASWTTSPGPAE